MDINNVINRLRNKVYIPLVINRRFSTPVLKITSQIYCFAICDFLIYYLYKINAMNIFIGNISERLKEEHVRELFEAFGVVTKVKILKDYSTGISKGMGFVEMKYEADGKSAIANLNKCELDGKIMRVSIAKDTGAKSKNPKKRF